MRMCYAMNGTNIGKKISKLTKMKIWTTIFKPILTHDNESWIVTNKRESKIQVAEVWEESKFISKLGRIKNKRPIGEFQIELTEKFVERRRG